MHTYRRLAISGLLVGMALTGAWLWNTPAHAQTPEARPAILFNVTSGVEDIHAVTMAMQLANHALDDQRPVTIFLNVRGTEFARTGPAGKLTFRDNPPIQEMLKKLMARGAKVIACPHCMEALGISADQLAEGIETASREAVFGPLTPGSVVFSY